MSRLANRRTVHRDIDFLSAQGVPLWQEDGRFGLNRTRYLATVRLSYQEAMALVLAGLLLVRNLDERNPHVSGAAGRVGRGETAFSYRDAQWVETIIGADPEPANNKKMIAWVKDTWLALHPYTAGGGYVNFLMDEGKERVQATYRENYPRLASIKAKYDPTNFFHINQNIQPEG